MSELAEVIELNNVPDLNLPVGLAGRNQLNPAAAFIGYSFLNGKLFAHGLDFTCATPQTVKDYQGNLVSVPAGQIAFRGARYLGNGWTIQDENGDYIHPLAPFFFKGQCFWRLAHFEAWVGATTAVALGKRIAPGDGTYWECTTAGTTGGSQPTWTPVTVTDGTVEWTYRGLYQDEIGLQVAPASTNLCECFSFPLADEEIELFDGNYAGLSTYVDGDGAVVGTTADSITLSVSASGLAMVRFLSLAVGRVYRLSGTYTIDSGDPGNAGGSMIGANAVDYAVTQDFDHSAVNSSSYARVGLGCNVTLDQAAQVTITNLSLKEVKHAIGTKATTASDTTNLSNILETTIVGYGVSGDADGYLHIRAATAAEDAFYGQVTGWASKMYEANNSAGSSSRFVVDPDDSSALNLTPHAVTVYAEGSGDVGLVAVAGQTAITSTFQRYEFLGTVTGAGNGHRIRANIGGTVSFAIPQLEEMAYSTPPILTDGASATRDATDVSLIKLSQSQNITIMVDSVPLNLDASVNALCAFVSGSDYWTFLQTAANTGQFFVDTGGDTLNSLVSGGAVVGSINRMGMKYVDTSEGTVFVDGAAGNTDATGADLDTDAVIKLGQYNSVYDYLILKNIFIIYGTDTDSNMEGNTDYD